MTEIMSALSYDRNSFWKGSSEDIALLKARYAVGQKYYVSPEQAIVSTLLRWEPSFRKTHGKFTLQKYSRITIKICLNLGITDVRDMALYAYMGTILGLYFYRDPQAGEIGRLVSDRNQNPHARIREAYDLMLASFDDVFGDRFQYLLAAFGRIAAYQVSSDTIAATENLQRLQSELCKFWPEKPRQPADEFQRYVQLAQTEAQKEKFPSQLDGRLFAVLGFFLGIGFFRDPLFVWVNAILERHRSEFSNYRFVHALQMVLTLLKRTQPNSRMGE